MEVIQIISNFLNGETNEIKQAASVQINAYNENPNIIGQYLLILSNKQIPENIRYSAAVFMKQPILNFGDMYCDNLSAFNALFEILLTETNLLIAENVSFALIPIFERVGASWNEMLTFINKALQSGIPNLLLVATIFLINFLPNAGIEYVKAMYPALIPLLKNLLGQFNPSIKYGFQLFRTLQITDEIPEPEISGEFAIIFQQIINLYHQSLITNYECGLLSVCIAKSIKKEVPFDSPINIFQSLIHVASDENIPIDNRHFPLIPINTLAKYHGGELKSLLFEAVQLFINISASQFQNLGFENEDNSRTIINLFEHLCDITNGTEFFNFLMSGVNRNFNPAYSFASLCAIYGSDDIIEEYEQNIGQIVEYIFSKFEIHSESIDGICLILLNDLADKVSEAFQPFAGQAFQIATTYATNPSYSISRYAIQLISTIFSEVDLETSFILTNLMNLNVFYIQANELKPDLMSAIATAIYSCKEDIKPYANNFVDIITEGLQSNVPGLVISSVEALGNIMAFAPEQIPDLYPVGIEFILQNSQNDDVYLREVCLEALYNIINMNKSFNSGEDKILAFIPFIFTISISAIGTQINEEDIFEIDDTEISKIDIIKCGFLLLKALFKYHSRDIIQSNEFQKIIGSFTDTLLDFMNFEYSDIAIKAIKASAYFLLAYMPEDTKILECYLNILNENSDKVLCQAVFKAYSKLISGNNKYAPAVSGIGDFIQFAFSALNRNMNCQIKNCVNEENRFNFDADFFESVYGILCESFKINLAVTAENLMPTFNFLIDKVDKLEVNEILGTCGELVLAGGQVNPEILQIAINELGLIDYSRGPDAIFFIRALIKMHPEFVQQIVPNFITFCCGQLQTDVVERQFYWHIMTNVISSIFTISQSIYSTGINLSQLLPMILNKLPVKGDLDEADYIYSSLFTYLQQNPNEIVNNGPNLARVLVLTITAKGSVLTDYNLQNQTYANLINLTRTIRDSQANSQELINQILGGDEIRINRFNQRLG